MNNTTTIEYNVSALNLFEIADLIKKDHENSGRKVYFGAVPYLKAMSTLNSVNDVYMFESGKEIVIYLLANLTTWKSSLARVVKKELNKRIKQIYEKF